MNAGNVLATDNSLCESRNFSDDSKLELFGLFESTLCKESEKTLQPSSHAHIKGSLYIRALTKIRHHLSFCDVLKMSLMTEPAPLKAHQ